MTVPLGAGSSVVCVARVSEKLGSMLKGIFRVYGTLAGKLINCVSLGRNKYSSVFCHHTLQQS